MNRLPFTTTAVIAFVVTSLSVIAMIVNAATGNEFSQILLPAAVAALLGGGLMCVRAHILWLRGGRMPPRN